jgi:hypothetical protein
MECGAARHYAAGEKRLGSPQGIKGRMAQAPGSGPEHSRVPEKLGAKNSAEIVQYAIRNGLVISGRPKSSGGRPAPNLFSGLQPSYKTNTYKSFSPRPTKESACG